ncbi:MAG: hypothetical protein F6K40_28845 [Okeania sp. SIO3I5]|uniref:hypothetical protein n=1 Tax=Okeania sp. SIO3I5 TaxID=2607805 RepID=UPI0013B7B447|nr:hypothetical protein [Okeania sp. SIO3I5]NEQ40034.1 hypothetical protein [Okeania sp. SIO3I5]
MNSFTYHDYDQQSKSCRVCGRQFKSAPKADNCPGLEVRQDKKNEAPEYMLQQLNRYLKDDAVPIAYKDYPDYRNSKNRNPKYYIYSYKDTLIRDKSLPKAYKDVSDIPGNPISTKQMKEENLEPKEGAKSIGIVGFYGQKFFYWVYYYDRGDTQPGDGLNYITKGRLKSEYNLSEGWIKRLGEPDKLVDNPYYKKSAPMQLYQIFRVRKFLKDNADEYSDWLIKRDRIVLNYKRNCMIKKLNQAKINHQNKLCLKCKFSNFSDQGLLCKIHSTGLPDNVPMKMYCPDYKCDDFYR